MTWHLRHFAQALAALGLLVVGGTLLDVRRRQQG